MTTTLLPEALPAFTDAVRGSARLVRHYIDGLTPQKRAEVDDLLNQDIRLAVLVFPEAVGASCKVIALDGKGAYRELFNFKPDPVGTQASN